MTSESDAKNVQKYFPLYDPRFEHDACGTGFVANISGKKSNKILKRALKAACNVTHRGAVDADAQTGDGAGILTQLPLKFFLSDVPDLAAQHLNEGDLAVGMIFMPHTTEHAFNVSKGVVESVVRKRELRFLGWRIVPTDSSYLGDKAAATQPNIRQVLVGRPQHLNAAEFERALYISRREIEKEIQAASVSNFYVASFSSKSIVYKGLMTPLALDKFYVDLQSPDYETALAIFHQRFSTNTFPRWELAHPFRMLGHNGEINTIQGNRNWTNAREAELESNLWRDDVVLLKPILQSNVSDSANVDNALEALTLSGRHILHAMLMIAPEAWNSSYRVDPAVRAFFEYHECLSEPWDGPAALIFSDGVTVAASLDRNGLRPCRYKITDDGLIVVGSEVGPVDMDDANVVQKGRLGPGQMIAVDTARGILLKDIDIKREIASQRPYSKWVGENLYRIRETATPTALTKVRPSVEEVLRLQLSNGYSAEELSLIFPPMIEEGKEPVGSMGDDTPLAILSRQPRLLSSYFKQQFAQVTNPPIDHIREKLVMSLTGKLGLRRNWFGETPEHARQVQIQSPFLFDSDLEALRSISDPAFQASTISTLFTAKEGIIGAERRIEELCAEVEKAADEGKYLVILSDRGIDEEHAALPMLLATGAVHNHLLRKNKRLKLSVVTETSEPRDIHHFATLIGYGVNAINPYLALETIRRIMESRGETLLTLETAFKNFKIAIESGILKIISKMGISLLGSYRGAQIFEAVGIGREVVDKYFTNTPSRIGGLGLKEIIGETLARHDLAYGHADAKLADQGMYRFKKSGELHAWSPDALRAMQQLRKSGNTEDYAHLANALNDHDPIALKDLMSFKSSRSPLSVREVEPAEEIMRRFTTAAMSLGSLSPEAHETVAIAMNRIGGKSNTGEGGEDPERFRTRANGDSANSAIKQVASARFGVTAEYLVSAKEIEIKMAQGSKPGEGGQLPGHKVSSIIAKLRRATPGVQLISPPPHHDIYSIEDLAQLIYDLKQVNPRAKICVKLVSEAGVGTIAAGVAKAHADTILISGHEGGTGASPLSSVKNAGSCWELGIAEAQQVLVLNGLRDRVTLRADGGMKTGRDIVIAAMLGAEEFNFGTAALIAIGCRYVRQCHLNTCPVGIATQDEKLRTKFDGKPEMLINYFLAVANDAREIVAKLGFASLNEIIGRTDLLEQVQVADHPKANMVDLSAILSPRDKKGEHRLRIEPRKEKSDSPLDDTILLDVQDAIRQKTRVVKNYKIHNTNRSVGAKLAGELAYLYGDKGLAEGTIELRFKGSAGQSFGAFLVNGIRMILVGESNDYVGKGMSGGEIVIMPPLGRATAALDVIVGNTVLYGATGGTLFASGRAGERFCVRNSGALAVIEGLGDHGCEYMTNGTVVVLGSTGKNFGAGMTGGKAYVFDADGNFKERYNKQLIGISRLESEEDVKFLQAIVYRHLELTDSQRAREILNGWQEYSYMFWKVTPFSSQQGVAELNKALDVSKEEDASEPVNQK